MRRILILTFVIMYFALPRAWAQDASYAKIFKEANQLYSQSKYEEALSKYQKLVLIDPTPEAYYNLGNAYFKTKKLGEAIAAYEKAKILAPRDTDVRKNLRFASTLIQSKVTDREDVVSRELERALSFVTLVECQIVVLSMIAIILIWMILLLALGKNPFRGWVIQTLVVFLLLTGAACGLKYYFSRESVSGIVIRPDAEVRYGPAKDEKVIFRLSEGLKLKLLEDREGWERVQLTNKDTGWISKDDVEIINIG